MNSPSLFAAGAARRVSTDLDQECTLLRAGLWAAVRAQNFILSFFSGTMKSVAGKRNFILLGALGG